MFFEPIIEFKPAQQLLTDSLGGWPERCFLSSCESSKIIVTNYRVSPILGKMKKTWATLMMALLGCVASWAETAKVYVAGGGGIHLLELDLETGVLVSKGVSAELAAASFLAVHPNGWFLFAANNDGDRKTGKSSHAVSFFIEPGSGKLHEMNAVETGGTASSYVELDARGRIALVANFGGGSIATFQIGLDGKLSERVSLAQHEGSSVKLPVQSEPHPHAIRISPDQRFAYAPDMGTDEVFIYGLDHANAKLVPTLNPYAKVNEGSGPRHFDFHPTAAFAYLINQISSEITVFKRDVENGSLTAVQTVGSLPKDFVGNNSTAEIRVHPSGKFVYGSNRGHNSIAVFKIDETSGLLTLVEHEPTRGESPRHFAIDPDGKWLIAGNQKSGSLAVFSIDSGTGELTAVGDVLEIPGPRCIVIPRSN
ncbi:MAG: 6-phosphogluconolactonase [Verrucomicrobiales bacterium]